MNDPIRLRPATAGDAAEVASWCESRAVWRDWGDLDLSWPIETTKVARMLTSPGERYWVGLVDTVPVGLIGVGGISVPNRRVVLRHVLVEPIHRAQGIGSAMTARLTDWLFSSDDLLGVPLHRIGAEVIVKNTQSVEMLCGLGFQIEGTIRQCHFGDDATPDDVFMLGLLRSEWVQR